jgi:formylglycine-generating enzyme required for sulfatase activity
MRLLRRLPVFLFCLLATLSLCADSLQVTDVRTVSRWPFAGEMDIYYTVNCSRADAEVTVSFAGYDGNTGKTIAMNTEYLSGDGIDTAVTLGKEMHAVWDAASDRPNYRCDNFTVRVTAHAEVQCGTMTYLVVDLSGGSEATNYPVEDTDTAPNLSDDSCRTTKLWLRRIPAGSFTMGSPTSETGRDDDETQHTVKISKDYYIGVFECTQKQYELVMGKNPSQYTGDARPVDSVSYDDIRGSSADAGAGWPAKGHQVDADSFMGRLQARTGMVFDLPTEAQWEYACRLKAKGNALTTALNSGKALTGTETCTNLASLGRYYGDQSDNKGGFSTAHTKVGSYTASGMGLYDMHGNVWELCLDWYAETLSTATDPTGNTSGSYRVERGGSWDDDAQYCRAASRAHSAPANGFDCVGFRIFCEAE